MTIDYIKKQDLLEYAESAYENFDGEIPINISRARSQVLNPFAKNDDVLLITAREDKKLLAYIGIMPGIVRGEKGKKLYWNTSWRAVPDCPVAVSIGILREFQKIYDNNIAFSDLGDETFRIVETLGIDTSPRDGLMIRFRKNLHQRSLKKSMERSTFGILRILRGIGIFKFIDLFFSTKKIVVPLELCDACRFEMKYEKPDPNFINFIRKSESNSLSIPGEEYFDWIHRSKWLLEPDSETNNERQHYYFSSIAEDFHYSYPILYKEREMVYSGFLSSRDGVVKTMRFWGAPEFQEDYFYLLCAELQSNKNLHTLITADTSFVNFLTKNMQNSKRNKFIRYSGTGNKNLQMLQIADFDGDYVFW